jgi:hypothetical protein
VITKKDIEEKNERLKKVLSTITADGNTNMMAAIKQLQILSETSELEKHIYFFTDGEPTWGEMNPDILIAEIKKTAENARFGAIGFGDSFNEKFLTDVAKVGNGQFLYIRSDSELKKGLTRTMKIATSLVAGNVAMHVPGMVTKTYKNEVFVGRMIEINDLYGDDEKAIIFEMDIECDEGTFRFEGEKDGKIVEWVSHIKFFFEQDYIRVQFSRERVESHIAVRKIITSMKSFDKASDIDGAIVEMDKLMFKDFFEYNLVYSKLMMMKELNEKDQCKTIHQLANFDSQASSQSFI